VLGRSDARGSNIHYILFCYAGRLWPHRSISWNNIGIINWSAQYSSFRKSKFDRYILVNSPNCGANIGSGITTKPMCRLPARCVVMQLRMLAEEDCHTDSFAGIYCPSLQEWSDGDGNVRPMKQAQMIQQLLLPQHHLEFVLVKWIRSAILD